MVSPMMAVMVLAVLWMIVVVPMIIQKMDARRGERSAAKFSGAMRALAKGRSLTSLARPVSQEESDSSSQPAARPATRPQLFVPGSSANVAAAARRPVPAAMEAVMYPERVAKADMSDARRRMMTRRRRSLTLLSAGTVLGLLWSIASGTTMSWSIGLAFLASLGGYLYFLRGQALRDRDRRENRLTRSGIGQNHSYDVTEQLPPYEDMTTVVRIDDDDVELHGMADTIDLTGLYVEEDFDERPMRRAV